MLCIIVDFDTDLFNAKNVNKVRAFFLENKFFPDVCDCKTLCRINHLFSKGYENVVLIRGLNY